MMYMGRCSAMYSSVVAPPVVGGGGDTMDNAIAATSNTTKRAAEMPPAWYRRSHAGSGPASCVGADAATFVVSCFPICYGWSDAPTGHACADGCWLRGRRRQPA